MQLELTRGREKILEVNDTVKASKTEGETKGCADLVWGGSVKKEEQSLLGVWQAKSTQTILDRSSTHSGFGACKAEGWQTPLYRDWQTGWGHSNIDQDESAEINRYSL